MTSAAEPLAPDPLGDARAGWRGAVEALALAWRGGPHLLGGYAGLMVVAAILPVGVAWLTKLALDTLATPAPSGSRLGWLASGLILAGVAVAIYPHASAYLQRELARRIGLTVQDRLFQATERLTGLARFEDPAFLNRLELAQGTGGSSPGAVVDGTLSIGRNTITAIGFAGSLLVISPWLAAAATLAAVPALLAELRISRQRAALQWRLSPLERREIFYQRLLTSVQAAKELRLFGVTGHFRRLLVNERRQINSRERWLDRRELATQASLGFLTAGIAGAGLGWAVFAAWRGVLTIGDVSLLVVSLAAVQGAVTSLVSEVTITHHQLLLFDHYRIVTKVGPDLPIPARPGPTPRLRSGIEVRGVWFRYSSAHAWALHDLSLTIPCGRSVALVGRNGAGKSTLVKLLCRLYDPQRGEIRWDGVDLRDLDPAELRQRIGVVFQDYMEYDLSASNNIGLGDLNRLHDRERIEAAARRAGVHEPLTRLPRGYDTLLSRVFFDASVETDPETVGVVLSGGQWQRLALARALMRDQPDLLILDEPSSGLDAEAEHEIHTRLREHRAGRTSVLISHRLGAVRDADLLVVLDQGRVVEQGNHRDLLARGGSYARLFTLQSRGYQVADPTPAATP